MTTTEPWVSVREIASHLGVRKDSIYRWIEHRELPARKIGKLWKLKLSEVDAWVRAGGADENLAAIAAPAGLQIMLVDDDPLIRDSVTEFLVDEGYRVLAASDGAEALAILASHRPAVILLDLELPNVDGWKFREAQLADPALADIPVIVVTATSKPALDGVVIMRKPLLLPQITRAIEDVLAARTGVTA